MKQINYKQLADILSGYDLSPKDESTVYSVLQQNWSTVAGPNISENTENIEISGDMLLVSVNSPTWAHEIINRQKTLLSGMNNAGYPKLTNLSVNVHVSKPATLDRYKKTPNETVQQTTPQLRKLFKKLAAHSNSPEIKATFTRMSKR